MRTSQPPSTQPGWYNRIGVYDRDRTSVARTSGGPMTAIGWLAARSRALPDSRWKARLGRVVSKPLVAIGCDPLVGATQRDGSRLFLDARSRTESGALWNGVYDADDIEFLLACLSDNSVFLDIGANVGLITIPIARRLHRTGGRVVAVEPIAANVDHLRRSIVANGLETTVRIVQVALGDHKGAVSMMKEGSSSSSDNALVVIDDCPDSRRHQVELTTLDLLAVAGELDRVDVVKIDVEGFEVPVLRGGLATITRLRPVVYGEFHNRYMPLRGDSFLDVWRMFEPLGYDCFSFVARCRLKRANPTPFLGNAVLIPGERVEAVLMSLEVARSTTDRPAKQP